MSCNPTASPTTQSLISVSSENSLISLLTHGLSTQTNGHGSQRQVSRMARSGRVSVSRAKLHDLLSSVLRDLDEQHHQSQSNLQVKTEQ